ALRCAIRLLSQLQLTTTLRSALMNRKNVLRNTMGLLSLLLLLSPLGSAHGQQSNTLFLMHSVPQSSQLNPAVQPECRLFIGLPRINTLHFNYANSSFTYNDLTAGNTLSLDAVFNRLYRMNMISVEAAVSLFSVGYRHEDNYFAFSVADRLDARLSFPRDLAGLLLYGNANYIGNSLDIRNTRLNASYYREYSASWSQKWDRFTTVGLRGKLLFGKANFHTGRSRVTLGTDVETFDLSMQGGLVLNSSFPMELELNDAGMIDGVVVEEPDYRAILMNPRNVGLAFDAGVVYQYSDHLSFSASLLDAGLILWRDDVYNLSGEVDFSYSGVSDEADFSLAGYYRDISDSISERVLYNITEQPYVSLLPVQLILGGSYRWRKNVDLGLVLRNVPANRGSVSSLTALANMRIAEMFRASVSWSLLSNSFRNLGAGLAYTGMGVQFYAVTDNILGFVQPLDSRTVNLRFGMNLMLGCPQNYYRVRPPKRSMVPCPRGLTLGGRRR
ncbi:MAG: DUF5723 family protein, partial [Bacteroidales bacterium]|nr:DUF5723 family protein [Bacteroidales bacterium]